MVRTPAALDKIFGRVAAPFEALGEIGTLGIAQGRIGPAEHHVGHGRALKGHIQVEPKKAEDIRILDVRGLSGVTDHMVLCSGISAPHLRALSEAVAKELRAATPPVAPHRTAGTTDSGWVVMDYHQFVVHIFSPEMRAYYALENLWKDAPEA